MKCKIPEISWHNRDPVLSVDIQSKPIEGSNTIYRLASGGTDQHVLIWYVNLVSDGQDIALDLAADLTRHQRAVNCVKWSPSGELLASGDDESVIFIWKQKGENELLNILETTNDQDKEVWITLKILRGHMEDVYDLSWSPNSLFLVSGSVDNTAIIWDINKGKSLSILNDHKGFVQGVAWDPKNQYIATLSTDRYLRIFDIQSKKVVHRINKGMLPVPEGNELHGHRMRYFHDDTLQTFFRRLSFTPDGKFLLTPSGVTDYDGVTRPSHTAYLFSRYAFRQPSIVLPFVNQYTIAVRACPLLYRLRPHNAEVNPPVIPLPYRMVFAVATKSSVYFYDTQQKQPFALVSNIHYTRLTDITWSNDGLIVIVSSTDGFCSLITFEKGELGEEYEDSEAVLNSVVNIEALTNGKKKKQKENDVQTQKTRKSSTDEVLKAPTVAARKPLMEKIIETKTDTTANHTAQQTTTDKDEKSKKTETFAVTAGGSEGCDAAKIISTPAAVKPATVEIIIDKEILSSDEKFESPEKKSRPATPISIRRHPRTPNSNTTPTASKSNKKLANSSPLSSLKEKHSPNKTKRANPIAIRRTPRALITPAGIEKPAPIEEAMDAWPLVVENISTTEIPSKDNVIECSIANESNTERTEDIRLVYEETVEEAPAEITNKTDDTHADTEMTDETCQSVKEDKLTEAVQDNTNTEVPSTVSTPKSKQQTPNNKTPRRVPLKTISTPKSKKKL